MNWLSVAHRITQLQDELRHAREQVNHLKQQLKQSESRGEQLHEKNEWLRKEKKRLESLLDDRSTPDTPVQSVVPLPEIDDVEQLDLRPVSSRMLERVKQLLRRINDHV